MAEQAVADMKAEMVALVGDLENRCKANWEQWSGQAVIWGKKVKDVENAVKDLEEKVKSGERVGSKSNFNYKDAKDVKPGAWDDMTPFTDLSMEVRTWARTFHDDFRVSQ